MMPAGETEASPSAWTIDSAMQHIAERLATVEKAAEVALTAQNQLLAEIDRRYEQRFMAQEQATALALARVDKEFHEHLQQVRSETHAALMAADTAIAKAEAATERRFESVNEFRAQLSDQATRFMPRLEAEQRMAQNAEKIGALDERHREDVSIIASRLDMAAGRGAGLNNAWGYLIAVIGLAGGVIGIIIAVTQ